MMHLMDFADAQQPNKPTSYGKKWVEETQLYVTVPTTEDRQAERDMVMSRSRKFAAAVLGSFHVDGIVLGTGCARILPVPKVTQSHVLVWSRSNRADSFQQQVSLHTGINMRLLINEGSLTWDSCSFVCFYTFAKAPLDEEVHLPRQTKTAPQAPQPPQSPVQFRMDDDDSEGQDTAMDDDIDEDNPTTPEKHTRTETDTDRSRSSRTRPTRWATPLPKPLMPPPQKAKPSAPSLPSDSDRSRSDRGKQGTPKGHAIIVDSSETDTSHSRSQRGPVNRRPPPAPPGAGKAKATGPARAKPMAPPTPSPATTQPLLPLDESTDTMESDATVAYPETAAPSDNKNHDDHDCDNHDHRKSDSSLLAQTTNGRTFEQCCADFAPEIRKAYKAYCKNPPKPSTAYIVNDASWTFDGQRCHDGRPFWEGRPGLTGKGPWKTAVHFATDLADGTCYRVDADTDNLSIDEMHHNEEKIKLADRAEIDNFLQHKVFYPRRRRPDDLRPIDCTWVRKWKWKPLANGIKTKVVKSRLCCRGFLDPQKNELFKSSTTATRLSQKLLASSSVQNDWEIESWDIGSAFLRGLSFTEVNRICAALGVPSPIKARSVTITVPGNVLYHLWQAGFLKEFTWHDVTSNNIVLELTKAMYGLCDAPLLWQLSLRYHFRFGMGATESKYDDCYYMFRNSTGKNIAEATVHVDDNNFAADKATLDNLRSQVEARFGKVARQQLPFDHVGLTFARTYDHKGQAGLHIHQAGFCKALKPEPITRGDNNDRALTPQETTKLRGLIGALLYLCFTRADIMADVTLLSSRMNRGTIKDMREANATINRSQKYPHNGLIFRKLKPPLVLYSISDASFASASTSYAVEGHCVCLAEQRTIHAYKDGMFTSKALDSQVHLLLASSKKAKRVSHSTSHAEALAMYNTTVQTEQVAARLTETRCPWPPTLAQCITVEENGSFDTPLWQITDCMDLLELITGRKGVPQDRSFRLIILALRENV